jgi:[ribosomal protein S5]-alanine N-acetyltransferase
MFKLETKRLILRDLKESDKNSLQKNINNLEISKWLLVVPYPYSSKDAEWFIDKCIKDSKKEERTSYEFGIINKENNELLGIIGLTKINKFSSYGTIGYWLGEKYQRKGYMFEAGQEVIKFAFEKIGLRRLNIEVFEGNIPSENLIKKFGFEYEGTAKEKDKSKANNKIYNVKEFGMLKKNWEKSIRK